MTQPTTPVERTEQPVVEDGEREAPVTQADREAANDVVRAFGYVTMTITSEEIARAFARHRLAALTRPSAAPSEDSASSPDGAVGGVEGLDPLRNTASDVLQDGRDFVEQWRSAVAVGNGHDPAANTTTVRRFIRVIDSLDTRLRAALTASSTSGLPGDGGAFVAGPVWREEDEESECWTAEVQTVGGHNVVAKVHGGSQAEAEQRQYAILSALAALPTSNGKELEAAFRAGWDKCWCRDPDANCASDGGKQAAWTSYCAALAQPDAVTSGMPDRGDQK